MATRILGLGFSVDVEVQAFPLSRSSTMTRVHSWSQLETFATITLVLACYRIIQTLPLYLLMLQQLYVVLEAMRALLTSGTILPVVHRDMLCRLLPLVHRVMLLATLALGVRGASYA